MSDRIMQGYVGVLWCIAWIGGLLITQSPEWIAIITTIALPIIGILLRTFKPTQFQIRPWFIASAIVLIAIGWYHFRTPQPSTSDISRYINAINRNSIQIIGEVEALPRSTSSGKTQLWLKVKALDAGELNSRLSTPPEQATGKLYVTIADRTSNLPPGTQVSIKGKLYTPKPAQNPGGFDFQKYLAKQNCFAGLRAENLTIVAPNKSWGLWQLQQRIVQSQIAGLPKQEGLLLSAMVLGNRAVDLPNQIQDAFTKIGMSHALAASGFQVSLVLSVVLAIFSRSPKQVKAIAGSLAIVILIGLAGAQPAILRAAVMGFAVLVAIVLDKKIKPLGSLLFASTLILIYNPLWIWDLGFQLSALATLGLLVTSEPIQNRLDWMPSPIAAAFATPIAAYLWTIPLQLYSFGLVSPYSIPANVITTILISIISLGGMVSALCAAIVPSLGSLTAGLLHYPIAALLGIVDQIGKFPGSQWAIGTISLTGLILLYGMLLISINLHYFPHFAKSYRRHLILGMSITALSLVFIPAIQQANNRIQITALSTTSQPILIVQAKGKVLLVNTGDRSTSDNTILPFLQKQGINRIDALIQIHPTTNQDGVQALRAHLPISTIIPTANLSNLSSINIGAIELRSIDLTPMTHIQKKTRSQSQKPQNPFPILQLQLPHQKSWILLGKLPRNLSEYRLPTDGNILWWSGGLLPENPIEAAIAYGKALRPESAQILTQKKVLTFHLAKDGAVQWSPHQGFTTTFSTEETDFARL